MQHAVRSLPYKPAACAVRPPLRPTRPAARSRRQRGAPRAEAYPAESSPIAAAAGAATAAVAELRQLVMGPRPNKQQVQAQLQMVESALLLLVGHAELEAAQKDAELALAKQHAALAQKDVQIMEMNLQEVVRDLLDTWNMLHARGLLEFAEYRLFAPLSPTAKQDRRSKWQQLGKRRPNLQSCILEANPTWKAHEITDKAVELHRRLSAQTPLSDLIRTRKVLLVEGPLTREDIRFLECLARAVHCPVEVRYKELPAADEQGE